jgi:oxaloacetate decarboxylase beta subunit
LYNTNNDKIDKSYENNFSIDKLEEEPYSGGYSTAFQFRNFSGSGALWLEREVPVLRYTKYSMTIEYQGKYADNNELNNIIKPIIYIDRKNPNSIDGFKRVSHTFDLEWSKLEFEKELKTGDVENYWFAFGFYIEPDPNQGNLPEDTNGTGYGLNFTCFIDDVKITLEMSDLTIQEHIFQYLKISLMFIIGGTLIFLAIRKEYEPLLLLPIGTGIILANIPYAGMMDPGGIIYLIYQGGIKTGLFPLLIFLGIGSLTDFGPLLANPKTSLLGAAAQFGIFTTLIGALLLNFTLPEASSIGIIGGADGPTAIYLSINLAPHLLGPIAIAAYSYMALVPIIQPPIIRALTSEKERKVKMEQMRFVSSRERILFPIGVIIICAFILPMATPLVGMLMFGNLMRESGVVQRLANTAGNELINIVTIFLGVAVGATMIADTFLTFQTIAIILLGLAAFMVGTATGVVFGKIMYKYTGGKVNPMIGAAGVSAVPMAARVVQKMGLSEDPNNHLLMHAMGPNVAGVIGSAVAAGVLLTLVGAG